MSDYSMVHCALIARAIRTNLQAHVTALKQVQVGHIPRTVQARGERTGELAMSGVLPAASVMVDLTSSEPDGIGPANQEFSQDYGVNIGVFVAWNPASTTAWEDAIATVEDVANTFYRHPMVTTNGTLAVDSEAAVLLRADNCYLESVSQVVFDDEMRLAVWRVTGVVQLVGQAAYDTEEAV